jgi:hypothetical protein
MPYVNYIFASNNKESLMELNGYMDNINDKIIKNAGPIIEKSQFDAISKKYIVDNINSVYYDITKNEINSLNELIKLLFFHGIIDDIFEIKFI